MRISIFQIFFLAIFLICGNGHAQVQLPKCVLFGFGNCVGTLRFSNGDVYYGEFNYGNPNGKGKFTYGNGDSYSGQVVEGQRHGSGTYTSGTGDKYVGQFSEGKFQGLGTYYFLANNRSKGDVFVGEFSSNTFNGQGKYTHANGQVFVGSFLNGRKLLDDVSPASSNASTILAVDNSNQTDLESPVIATVPKVVATPAVVAKQVAAQALIPAADAALGRASFDGVAKPAESKNAAAKDAQPVVASVPTTTSFSAGYKCKATEFAEMQTMTPTELQQLYCSIQGSGNNADNMSISTYQAALKMAKLATESQKFGDRAGMVNLNRESDNYVIEARAHSKNAEDCRAENLRVLRLIRKGDENAKAPTCK